MEGGIGVKWMVSNDAKTILAGWFGLCLVWFYEHPTQFFLQRCDPAGVVRNIWPFCVYKCMTFTNA